MTALLAFVLAAGWGGEPRPESRPRLPWLVLAAVVLAMVAACDEAVT